MTSGSPSKPLPNPLAFTMQLAPMRARLLVLAAAALLTLLLFVVFGGMLENVEERVGAQGWKIGASTEPEQRLTIVAIDERSLAEVGSWPWSRETMAQLTDAIAAAGAQLQIFDIAFPEVKPGDELFLGALQNTNAVLAQTPVLESGQALQVGLMTHPLAGINCNAGNATTTQNFIANTGAYAGIPKGHIAHTLASDGAVREVPSFVCVEGRAYPALAISALLMATTVDSAQSWGASIQAGSSPLDPALTLQLDSYPGLSIPLDKSGDLRISFANAPVAYRAISAADVLNGTADTSMLQNTWALIGPTAFGMVDIVPTPYAGAAPGVELQARLLGSLLDNNIPYTPRAATLLLLLLSLAFGTLLFVLAGAREKIATYGLPIATVLMPLSALALHFVLISGSKLWLGWLLPALFSICAGSMLLLLELSRVRMERSRVYGNLNSYLPNDIARDIAFNLPTSSIEAKRCEVTLLNADLRNFSAYSEARPPEEAAALLHYFFVRATEIVERNRGSLHEFKGDGLLAVWDTADSEAAARALNAAQEIQVTVQRDLLPQQPPAGLEPLGLGIGIEQGSALIGSIGPAHRRSHTLLGDTVTITLRIQELTAELALPILVGESAARNLPEQQLESQGSYLLSGLRIPRLLFAPKPQNLKAEQPALKVVHGGKS